VAELESAYGGRVRVKSLHVGVNRTTLHGLDLFEADEPDGRPWLHVDRLRADVNLAGALRGQVVPGELLLEGADVTLRFNKEGALVTRWPVPANGGNGKITLPRLVINNSKIRFRRADGSELLVPHVNAILERDGD